MRPIVQPVVLSRGAVTTSSKLEGPESFQVSLILGRTTSAFQRRWKQVARQVQGGSGTKERILNVQNAINKDPSSSVVAAAWCAIAVQSVNARVGLHTRITVSPSSGPSNPRAQTAFKPSSTTRPLGPSTRCTTTAQDCDAMQLMGLWSSRCLTRPRHFLGRNLRQMGGIGF